MGTSRVRSDVRLTGPAHRSVRGRCFRVPCESLVVFLFKRSGSRARDQLCCHHKKLSDLDHRNTPKGLSRLHPKSGVLRGLHDGHPVDPARLGMPSWESHRLSAAFLRAAEIYRGGNLQTCRGELFSTFKAFCNVFPGRQFALASTRAEVIHNLSHLPSPKSAAALWTIPSEIILKKSHRPLPATVAGTSTKENVREPNLGARGLSGPQWWRKIHLCGLDPTSLWTSPGTCAAGPARHSADLGGTRRGRAGHSPASMFSHKRRVDCFG